MNNSTTRERIINAADQLFYQQGYMETSFADIGAAVRISRGNFYHHFQTKDEILGAVIEARLTARRELLGRWEAASESPADRIRSFIGILLVNREKIVRYGCPVGSLCNELAKLQHASLAEANQLLTLFRDWLSKQFAAMGCSDANGLALHLLARSQGVSSVANALHDELFIRREVAELRDWLQQHEKS